LGYGILTARELSLQDTDSLRMSGRKILLYVLLIFVGLFTLAIGADWVVKSAIRIAQGFGFSEVFIGISVVALGTSLPELATSVVAVAREESDISIGNVVGSNVFNVCLVMGMVGLLNPLSVDAALNRFEFPFMLLVAVLLFAFARIDCVIRRSHGLLFVLSFFSYIGVSYWLSQGR
jgi:cation:H+ antiporter